jgi:hypothetical protein
MNSSMSAYLSLLQLLNPPSSILCGTHSLEFSFMLRPTVSRPVSLGIKHPFGAYDQIFVTCVTVTVLILWGALSDERTGLSFIYGTRDHILLSQILDFPFRRLLRLAGSRWRYSIPPPHGDTLSNSESPTELTLCGPNIEHPVGQLIPLLFFLCYSLLSRNLLQSPGNVLIYTSIFIAAETCFH